MQNMAAESSKKNNILLPIIGGIAILILLIVIVVLSVGSKEQSLAYESTLAQITQISQKLTDEGAAVLEVSSSTPTLAPIEATPTQVEPTVEPATATPIADVELRGVSEIRYVCLDNSFDYAVSDYKTFNEDTTAFQVGTMDGDMITMNIPMLTCKVEVTFLQTPSEEVVVGFYQNRDPSAWYQKTLLPVEGQTNKYYAIINHRFIIDPPYWDVEYGLKIENGNNIFWEGTLYLVRPFSGLCWEGSVPDPVTLQCPFTDVLEREPHPDMPTLVPGGLSK
jgi:hypothetical protein